MNERWEALTRTARKYPVMVRDLTNAKERRREEGLELVRKNRARVRGVESKGVLLDFVAGDYVLVAKVRQPGIAPNRMKTWAGPWKVVSKARGHVCGVEYIVTKRLRGMNIERMRRYADVSLNITAELEEVFNNLKSRSEFDMQRIEAVDLPADSEKYSVTGGMIGLDEEETIWEPASTA